MLFFKRIVKTSVFNFKHLSYCTLLYAVMILSTGCAISPPGSPISVSHSAVGSMALSIDGRPKGNCSILEQNHVLYMSLVDIASLTEGTLHWFHKSRQTVLSLRGSRQAVFGWNAQNITVDGHLVRMINPSIPLEGDLFVPVASLHDKIFQDLFQGEFRKSADQTIEFSRRSNLSLPKIAANPQGFHLSIRLGDAVSWQNLGRQTGSLAIRFPRAHIDYSLEKTFDQGPVKLLSLSQQDSHVNLQMQVNESAGQETIAFDDDLRELSVNIPVEGAAQKPIQKTHPDIIVQSTPSASGQSVSAPPVSEPSIPPVRTLSGMGSAKVKKVIQKIMVDAGHGGRDVGALGPTGLTEKDINLLLAKSLASRLKAKGYQVALTRTNDVFVPLSERAAMANNWGADLFVSVHCNSSLSHRQRGFEIYFLSETASDPQAEAVAKTEN